MDLTPYVETLHRQLAVAAQAGGEDTRALAERLTGALDAATRLLLLEALSAAASEITRDLAPGSVEVRLRGRDPDFVVTPPPTDPSPDSGDDRAWPSMTAGAAAPPAAAEGDEPGGTSRITLRLPEHLKPHIDEAAAHAGLSVNAWLVRAVSAALEPHARRPRPVPDGRQVGRRFTGWVR